MAVHPPEHEAEKLRPRKTLLDGFLIGPGTEHVAPGNESGIDRSADRSATGANEVPVAGHSLLSVLGRFKADAQRPDAKTGSKHNGFRARRGHPYRWVRLLQRLRDNVAL